MVEGDAIGGDEDTSAIFPKTAVNENLFVGTAAKDGKELRDLFVAGSGPAADRKMNKADSQRFHLLTFPSDLVGILAAKIDDGGDAKLFELLQTLRVRLRAAV